MPVTETVRAYNPGPRIADSFYYSIEPPDKDLNNVRWWNLDAPKDSFFEIPREVDVNNRVYTLPLKTDVLRRYAERGVVIIEPQVYAVKDCECVTRWARLKTKEERDVEPHCEVCAVGVVRKSKVSWLAYCESVAQKHIDQCQQCRMNNMPPVPATGFTKVALIEAGYFDPADAYAQALKGQGDPKLVREVKEIQENFEREMQKMRNQLNEVTAASRNPKDPRNRAEDTNMGLEPGQNDAKANPGELDAPAGDRKGKARR